ncbi:MAG: hypothetical protein COY40_03180 [Alphaproteobacteria bacterium CG_4_10_14_0_8_um_filter_53_9]|nr:MAG: hypothetical protein COY40_03180 [Alphaproteobacteria bacterium CG_4_10_14_0_8_um_filter_53_9]
MGKQASKMPSSQELVVLEKMHGALSKKSEVSLAKLLEVYLSQHKAIKLAIFSCSVDGVSPRVRERKKQIRKLGGRLAHAAEDYRQALEDIQKRLDDWDWIDQFIYADDDYMHKSILWDRALEDVTELGTLYQQALKGAAIKRGRPKALRGLERFVFEMAALYQEATGQKFTVDDVRSDGQPVEATEGQRFVKEALELIKVSPVSDADTNFTPSNLQTACVYAAKKLGSKK